ncbi:MAG: phosphoribosylamine--glycine ligase, partial [Dehalococcoidales bacterium]|nr:phosphoribosylamine--glycine ligase [Dehalococcoidales bacterium]
MSNLRVLVIGKGGREHAITWKIAQSRRVGELFVAPGNAGTAQIARNVDINPEDSERLLGFAKENRIDITVVGPEQPLASGIVDLFSHHGLAIFGPTQKAARIESSKVFAKELMQRHGIPCARSASFDDLAKALDYVKRQRPPIVIKADGLAEGKGVIIAGTIAEAEEALDGMMRGKRFGKSGERVVIEEHLVGREMSYFVFTDGKTVAPTVPACDYKRIYDGNRGPNTGGMGSYSPPEFYNSLLGEVILRTI